MSLAAVTGLDARAFSQDFLRQRRPVVWRGGLASSTPVRTWTMASLRERFADVVVSMAGHDEPDLVIGPTIDALLARDALGASTMTTVVGEAPSGGGNVTRPASVGAPAPTYLRNVFVAEALPALFDEVEIPFFADGNLLTQPFLDGAVPAAWTRWVELFISGRGMRFPRIHVDTHQTHAWILQVLGEKKVWLWPPRRRSQKARIEDNFLTVDISDAIDGADVGRALNHADAVTGTIGPGDVLFIPAGWWHTVEALSLSITLSGNFVVDENLDDFLAFNRFLIDHADPVEGREAIEIARRVIAACAARPAHP